MLTIQRNLTGSFFISFEDATAVRVDRRLLRWAAFSSRRCGRKARIQMPDLWMHFSSNVSLERSSSI